ncbi:MAG: DUF4167 domain-containing protein [Ahrensia sp.]|nr:DUF4167 domain-containing protein [Ahrensia sp.]
MRQNNPQNRQRSRGRGNNNRNNNNRNQLNRSMESNGPDVRIRGTASHIAEKYTQMARDAQTSGDTVAAESYWQHAEHYNRLIAVAQAQQAEEQAKRDEERARRQEEHEKRQEARRQERDERDDDNEDDDDERGRGRRSRKDARDDAYSDDDDHETRRKKKKSKKAREQDEAANGADGPQPDVEGEPVEISLNGIGEGQPRKQRTRRKPASVADDANELPTFVTGD